MKKIVGLWWFLFTMLMPGVIYPQEPSASVEVSGALQTFLEAVRSKSWPLVAGAVLMVLIFGAGKLGLKDLVDKRWFPWVAAGLSLLGSVVLSLVGGCPLAEALIQGLLSGATAIACWELLKSLLKP
jgi:hypothetical protein